jgi:hydrogenase maturation factor
VVPLVKHLPREKIALLHDLAEGGLATALFELKKATGLGITIQADTIPWDEPALQLFNYLNWDPLYCSSFGNFLIVTEREAAEGIIQTVQSFNRRAAIIGAFTKKKQVIVKVDDKSRRLKPGEDPYKRYTAQIT